MCNVLSLTHSHARTIIASSTFYILTLFDGENFSSHLLTHPGGSDDEVEAKGGNEVSNDGDDQQEPEGEEEDTSKKSSSLNTLMVIIRLGETFLCARLPTMSPSFTDLA